MHTNFEMGLHTKNFCAQGVGNDRQLLATLGNQKSLRLAFGVHHQPKDAPSKLLRQIETEAQALAVSIAAGNHKLDYIAACLGKSRSYISRLQSGERSIPEKLIGPLCAATGSNLLRQFIELNQALCEIETKRDAVARLARLMEAA
jgi:transcriptional regulator with XRE-family HTH domain